MKPPPTSKEKLLDWVNDQRQLDPTSKFILYRLAQFADADCCAWSKVVTLADATNVSERTVQNRLRTFEGEGLIRRTGRMHRLKDSTREVPVYQMAPEVEGLGKPVAMGADSAPIDGDGCRPGGGMGEAACTRKGTEGTDVRPDGLTASERARSAGFDEAAGAYPQTGLAVTDFPRARQAWLSVTAEVAPEALLAAVRRYAAEDRTLRKGDFGAPAFEKWLTAERWRAWVAPGVAATSAAPAKVVAPAFAGPADLRADFVECFGEGVAGSWLDGCRWDGERRVLLARTGVAANWLGSTAWWWLQKHGLSVERFQEHQTAG